MDKHDPVANAVIDEMIADELATIDASALANELEILADQQLDTEYLDHELLLQAIRDGDSLTVGCVLMQYLRDVCEHEWLDPAKVRQRVQQVNTLNAMSAAEAAGKF